MMPDWTVTLSRPVIVSGASRTLETQAVVEATTHNLAVPMGIDAIFKSEAASGYQLVPKEAVDYWDQWRSTGGYLYEFQTEVEGKWGISFGISEIKEVNDDPRPLPHRNGGHQPAHGSELPDELPDLNSMLERHLKLLTDRQAVLSEELQRKQAEYDRNNADIMRITTMVTTTHFVAEVGTKVEPIAPGPIQVVKKPTGRKVKDSHAE